MRTVLFLASLIALAGCGSDPAPHPELDASRDAWTAALADSNGYYQYVRYSQDWTGYRQETTIDVSDGVVIGRSYVATDDDGTVDQWSEVGDAVGSNQAGHAPVTLDQLYDLCETEVLPHDEDHIDVTFAVFDDGTLRDCYFVDQSVEDSGADGVQLERIELEPQSCGAGVLPCG